MTELDFESDPTLQLLTDALRAGPGTPQWRQALAAVEHAPGAADEYKLLYAARERLASGRSYREVRAGPGFARKVFEAIDEEETARGPKFPAAANLIAAASALVILLVLAVIVYFVMPAGEKSGTTAPGGGELSQIYFVTPITTNTFDGEVGMEWGMFGSLPVQAKDGLRPILDNRTA